jgi:hypothetical protein
MTDEAADQLRRQHIMLARLIKQHNVPGALYCARIITRALEQIEQDPDWAPKRYGADTQNG